MATSVSVVDPRDHMADWECCPASSESIVPHITSPGKAQNSKFRVWFLLNAYRFCTIVKSKNHKWIPCGTVYFSSTLMVKRKYSDCSFCPPQGMNETEK